MVPLRECRPVPLGSARGIGRGTSASTLRTGLGHPACGIRVNDARRRMNTLAQSAFRGGCRELLGTRDVLAAILLGRWDHRPVDRLLDDEESCTSK